MSADVALDPAGFNALCMCRWGPMLYNRNDNYIGESLRRYGEYSWGEQELFAQILRPGAVVVEAGANIGCHTVQLSRLVGATGAVVAFEPQRLAFQTLCANLALNQCTNVWAVQEVLGARESMVTVPRLDPNRRNNFGGLELGAHAEGEPVRCVSLDAYALPSCQLIKIDVEGMESEVLRGARGTIVRCRPALYVENAYENRSAALIELIMQLGYDLYWHLPPLFNPNNFAGETENVFPNIISTNMICFPSEAKSNVQGFRRISSPADKWNG